jgi:chromosome segregation ATPase
MSAKNNPVFGPHHGLDERSVEFLMKAIEKNNLPGFDYIEYKRSLRTLDEMNLDEETAYKSAFATATTMGLTKDKLLKTADHYKVVLQKEKQQFEAAVNKQLAQKVKSKQNEVEKLKKQVSDYEAKITELKERIAKANQVIADAGAEIQAAEEKIRGTQENFEHTLQSLLNEIGKDVENIERYL